MDFASIAMAMTFARDAITAALKTKSWSDAATQIAQAQEQLLKAQDGLFIYSTKLAELQDKLRVAEGELAELKRMKLDRDQYSLVEISPQVFVYRSKPSLKPAEDGLNVAEPEHHLCEKCFQDGIKAILHQSPGYGRITLDCFRCGSKYYTGRNRAAPTVTFARGL